MNDSAEPHSSSLARLCSRSGRRGPNAVWRIDSAGVAGPVRKLVDDHGYRAVLAEREQRIGHLAPVPELQRCGRAQVRTEIGSDPAKRFTVGGFLRREVEAARRLAECAEQERLALAPAPGDHAEGGTRAGVRGEQGQLHPLEVSVEHVVRSPDEAPHAITIVLITMVTSRRQVVPG
jgi:hypothetical protein